MRDFLLIFPDRHCLCDLWDDLGIIMSATGNRTLAPAHAHLNLTGRVTMALFVIYYHLVQAITNR